MGSSMRVVLVHGGGTTGRFWDRLRPFLPGDALAVDLPGRAGRTAELETLTVDDEAASVVADILAADGADGAGGEGGITLVAHSSGGLVVPGAVAALGGRVERIVLNAASVPPEGGCGLDCMSERHRGMVEAVFAAADEHGRSVLTPPPATDPAAYVKAYGGPPLDDATAVFMADPVRSVVDTMHHYRQPVSWSVAAGVPVTYVRNLLDRPVPPELQTRMAQRLPHVNGDDDGDVEIVDLETGHIPAVTAPKALAAVILG